jgi:hypothetical protein
VDTLPDDTPAQRALRRFRTVTVILAVLAALLLILQYTPYALLHSNKTDTLWGLLVGIVGMGLVVDRRWTASARESQK